MPLIAYEDKKISSKNMAVIHQAIEIINELVAQGHTLTLRQLYYQFVARGYIPNNMKSYKRLGSIISDGRRAGLIDWNHIEDRTRNMRGPANWDSPAQFVREGVSEYDVDWWADQKCRVEVWIEKDALLGLASAACRPWKCNFFSCRGYVSDSEIWGAAQRHSRYSRQGQNTVVLHLGDHDPSGIDMTRDIEERLHLFADRADSIEVRRVALTMAQVEEVQPPPNPAKTTDSRFKGYQRKFGDESWELDALNPTYVDKLVAKHIKPLINQKYWKLAEQLRDDGQARLLQVAEQMDREDQEGAT